jgi:hypothetical protein
MRPRYLVTAVLLALLAGLAPVAYAGPTDPAWFDGLSDDADYDDTVRILTSESNASHDVCSARRPSARFVLGLASLPSPSGDGIPRVPYQLRAPPLG